MEFTFEDKLNYIEQILGVHLLDWQKKALQQVDEGTEELIWIPGKGSGRTVYMKAVKILNQLNEALNSDISDMASRYNK